MMTLANYIAQWVGAILVAAGGWTIAQAAAQDIERWVGGGVVLLAGVFMVRWALRTSERVEATYVSALEAAETRARNAEIDRDACRTLYETERRLRLQLEEQGASDRRTDPRNKNHDDPV